MFELYHSRRLSSRRSELIDVLKATSLGTLVIYLTAIFFKVQMVTPTFLVTFWAGSSIITVLSRIIFRRGLEWLRVRGRNLRFMLIAGTNPRAIRFARKIESQPELGYKLLGFVDNGWARKQEFRESGYHLVTDFDGFPSFIRENVVDEVMICLPLKSLYDQISTIASLCEEQGIIVRFLSDIFNLKLARSRTDSLEEESLISHYTGAMEGWQVLLKRGLDIIISFLSLLFLMPLLLITAVLIKITSRGPVFFIQERVGLNKRRFRLYKFRTMFKDAEQGQAELEKLNEVSGPVFKIKNDPRVTPIGRFLRKTSIDEFPQFINVLKGDMSMVGPRPLPVRDYKGFYRDGHRRRFSVRPGITCLWQINGRSNVPFEKWMELDIDYIDQWSLWLDFKILAKTVPSVLAGKGAS
jgi:exopolysaccharide biosynthesis polyprenyl glycosylphosphotransferase